MPLQRQLPQLALWRGLPSCSHLPASPFGQPLWSVPEVLMFETEDLVLRKNEKNFVLCLLEVARRASRFGMSAPILIQMEEEIEEEIREDLNLPPEETPLPKPQRKPCSFKNLDQMVKGALWVGLGQGVVLKGELWHDACSIPQQEDLIGMTVLLHSKHTSVIMRC